MNTANSEELTLAGIYETEQNEKSSEAIQGVGAKGGVGHSLLKSYTKSSFT